MSQRQPTLAVAIAVFAVACEKITDPVAIDVTEFQVHECNGGGVTHELMTGRNAADYVGLHCVAWRFGARSTVIDLINQPAGCGWGGTDEVEGTLWTPSVDRLASGALRFRVEWDFEGPSACGACFNDFSVELRKQTSRGPMLLELGVRDCTGDCDWEEDSMRLPLGEVDAGIACKYVPWTELPTQEQGKLHTPPRDGACDAPLVASEDDDPLCLAPCQVDADCPLRELLSCSDGLCRLSEPWGHVSKRQ